MIHGLAVCAGIGGLELGVQLALGPAYSCVCWVEWEAYPAAVLLARMEDSSLEPAPIWCGDLREFDTSVLPPIDMLTAGFPCQPHSLAGKQLGAADDRNLWPEVCRVADELHPSIIFVENVPGILRFAYEHVLPDLQRLGYRIEAGLFSAAEVGAPHRRQRLFVLAHAKGSQHPGEQESASR